MKFLRFFGKVGFIFVVGGIGGVVANQVVVPRLAQYPALEKFLGVTPGVTVINPKEEIIIDKADAVRVAVSRVRPTVVAVERYAKTASGTGELEAAASGIILTEDGFVATDAVLVSSPGALFVVRADERIPAKLSKIDSQEGLALVKVEARGLPVPNFGDAGAFEAGDTAFGIRAYRDEDNNFIVRALVGYVTHLVSGSPSFSFTLGKDTRGMPVFNTHGELVAISHSSATAGTEDSISPTSVIKDLLAR